MLYIADYMEPNRDFPGVDDLRRAVWADLDGGTLLGLRMIIGEMERWDSVVHTNTYKARDYLAQQIEKGETK